MADRKPSLQTLRLLDALAEAPAQWRYGYDLTKQTGVGPGTLYPALDRLASRGLLESEWRPSDHEGRPPRHAYRLTADGVRYARTWLSSSDALPMGALA